MKILANSRQMPSSSTITKQKNYSDLLYAWLQCNSDKSEDGQRRIHKSKVVWTSIEKDLMREVWDESVQTTIVVKPMNRRTIAKYFNHLIEEDLVKFDEDDGYFYLTTLSPKQANLIEYHTLNKMVHVLQDHAISIYVYIFNCYWANGCEPVSISMRSIKEHIGIATTTTSNNAVIMDTIEILERLGLLRMSMVSDGVHMHMVFSNVRNSLPEI
jgi:hypothetical protein